MNSLPIELAFYVARYLPCRDYFRFYSTCKALYYYRLPLGCDCQASDLFRCLENGDEEIAIQMLQSRVFDGLYSSDCFCVRAFFLASRHNRMRVMEHMLREPRLHPESQSSCGLVSACENGHTQLVSMLLEDGRSPPDDMENEALAAACSNGFTKIAHLLLLDPRVHPDADDNFAIKVASRSGYTDIVELLLANPRVSPQAEDNYCLRWSALLGHYDIVTLLLNDKRVNLQEQSFETLEWALDGSVQPIVDLVPNHC
ncbi:hypothetical protein EDD86DRAFT_199691 [Gorgonomyces haynaldii]|nr:hypothetical protein EDD86DRAFT_199691 [Gorgonomyces haynaldii]